MGSHPNFENWALQPHHITKSQLLSEANIALEMGLQQMILERTQSSYTKICGIFSSVQGYSSSIS